MKRSRVYSLGGMALLITSGAYLMVYALDPFDLGDEFRSPVGAAACVVGIAAAAGLIAAAVVTRRAEQPGKRRERAKDASARPTDSRRERDD